MQIYCLVFRDKIKGYFIGIIRKKSRVQYDSVISKNNYNSSHCHPPMAVRGYCSPTAVSRSRPAVSRSRPPRGCRPALGSDGLPPSPGGGWVGPVYCMIVGSVE